MAEQVYLGVDLGAESGRVMAGLFDGKRIKLQELHRFPNGPVSLAGTMRWNVLGLWDQIQSGLAKAATEFGERITSVGVDTWGVDYVLLSPQDELLGMPYNYRDPRTQGMMEHAFTKVPREEIFAQSGLQFMEINTLYQLLAMQQQHPDLMSAAGRFLMMPDFFHWCLSGSRVVEFTNATTSQCFHPTENNWAFDLLRKLELPTEIFPEVVAPGTALGKLRNDVANRTGLERIEVVTPATHDTGAAVAAVPTAHTGQANWAYISSGTWSLMGVEVNNAILTPRALELNVTNEGGIDDTYRLLKNIMGLWLVQQCRNSFERQGHPFDYDQMADLATEADEFVAMVDPDDPSFLNPDDMPKAMNAFCEQTGQTQLDTMGQFVRCALESLALKYKMVLTWLEELTGTTVEVIHIVGGGTKNELLNQFTANACGKPVVTGPVEATVLGNLLIQARTAGELSSLSDIRQVVRDSSAVRQYDPQDRQRWQDAYGKFQELLSRPGG